MPPVPLFHAEALGAGFPGRPVLRQLTFDIPSGRIVGLLGPNGAGKSTLLRLLAGLHAPSQGILEFMGRPPRDWPPAERARKIAYLPQESHTPFALRVEEVVWQGRYPAGGRLMPRSPQELGVLEAILRRADAASLAGREFNRLSGGEKKRTLLARMMAQEAPVWLLDEPLANLDLRHQRDILRCLRQARDAGVTVVLSEHHVEGLARVCDRLLLLAEGRTIAEGPPEAVIRPALLEEAYGVAVHVHRPDAERWSVHPAS